MLVTGFNHAFSDGNFDAIFNKNDKPLIYHLDDGRTILMNKGSDGYYGSDGSYIYSYTKNGYAQAAVEAGGSKNTLAGIEVPLFKNYELGDGFGDIAGAINDMIDEGEAEYTLPLSCLANTIFTFGQPIDSEDPVPRNIAIHHIYESDNGSLKYTLIFYRVSTPVQFISDGDVEVKTDENKLIFHLEYSKFMLAVQS